MINKKIIKLASKTNNYGLINEYTHKVKMKNKKCGDSITMEIKTKKNKISSIRYETNSCIFCEASASLLSNKIYLFKINSFNNDVKIINKVLEKKIYKLPSKLKAFRDILNQQNHSRMDCIILPFMAIIKALRL